jgi:hypothetical protein
VAWSTGISATGGSAVNRYQSDPDLAEAHLEQRGYRDVHETV